jgi:phosphate acyltransferase
MRIALDAMGGDHAPETLVRGALDAVTEHDLEVILVGDEAALAPELEEAGEIPPGLHVHHASEVVEMEDHPSTALRRKKDSSLRVAFDLVRDGEAQALVSAGNSGAALAMGIFVLKRVPGVTRPAIVATIPTTHGPVVLLDAGANVDCKPELLRQFALMGSVFSEVALGCERPRVGLLSNGEEKEKGNDTTRAADALIAGLPIHYTGYVEAREIYAGSVDVVVADGFVGNIVLKVTEGVAEQVAAQIRQAVQGHPVSMAGAMLMRGAFRRTRETLEYSEIGGALLMGVQGCTVIAHGRADRRAICSALKFADRLVANDLDLELRHRLEALDKASS